MSFDGKHFFRQLISRLSTSEISSLEKLTGKSSEDLTGIESEPASIEVAMNGLESFAVETRDIAIEYLVNEGVAGNLLARRALILGWECLALRGKPSANDLAREWIQNFVQSGDRRAHLIIGRILLDNEQSEKWIRGRKMLIAAAFDPTLMEVKWPREIDVREQAVLAMLSHYSEHADGKEGDPERAIWIADLAASLGYRGALVVKAREFLLHKGIPEGERKMKAIACLEEYLSVFGPDFTADKWPRGYTIPEVDTAERLLDELREESAPNQDSERSQVPDGQTGP